MNTTPAAPFRIGVVTGIQSEANIVRNAMAVAGTTGHSPLESMTVACRGPGAARAHDAARRLVDDGARALLSFGLAGGCDPALPAGTIVIATGIRDTNGETLWTNREWRRRLKAALLGNVLISESLLAAVDAAVLRATDKQAIFQSHAAAAIDMESGAIARVAIATGIPFLAVRAIVDPASMNLPKAALAGMTAAGDLRPGATLRAVAVRPQDIPPLVHLALMHRRALQALRRTAAIPNLGAV